MDPLTSTYRLKLGLKLGTTFVFSLIFETWFYLMRTLFMVS